MGLTTIIIYTTYMCNFLLKWFYICVSVDNCKQGRWTKANVNKKLYCVFIFLLMVSTQRK